MTITITTPLTGDPWGPAFYIRGSSDFVGPLEPDSFWRITLTAPPNEDIVLVCLVPTSSTLLATEVLSNTLQAPGVAPVEAASSHGMPGQLQVELVEPTGGVVDDETVTIVLDRMSATARELRYWLEYRLNQQPVGLTTDQGEQLQRVEAAVAITSGFGPLDLLTGLASAIGSVPPLQWGSLSGVYTISGDGDLPDIHAVDGKYGVYWIATSIPAGLGQLHGNTQHFQQRIVQWRTTHLVGGLEMVTELLDADFHGALWRWQQQKPERLSYSILPGVVLEARYWQFP